jgi:casein kinase II subunit beta
MSKGKARLSLLPDTSARSWLVEIEDYYLQSAVSYYGLSSLVPYYSRALGVIRGSPMNISKLSPEKLEKLQDGCYKLYGLLHQRFVITEEGLHKLHRKYSRGIYGKCPRYACNGQCLLPMGLSNELGISPVKLWFPK